MGPRDGGGRGTLLNSFTFFLPNLACWHTVTANASTPVEVWCPALPPNSPTSFLARPPCPVLQILIGCAIFNLTYFNSFPAFLRRQ